jgi:hypothetical protein
MTSQVLGLIKLGIELAQGAYEGRQSALKARDLVLEMVGQGRDPTDAEWAALNAATDDLHAKIQEAGE